MKLTRNLRDIEDRLGFQLPAEIANLYRSIANENESTYLIDTRSVGSHWLLNEDYFLVRPGEFNTKDRGRFFIKEPYVGEGEDVLERVNHQVSRSVNEYWSEDKVFVFAWSNDVVEKDASLVYVFENDGTVKGIYAYSLNYVESRVFVAEKLSDIFRLDDVNSKLGRVRFAAKEQGEKVLTYKELLKDSYVILDLESVDDVADYGGVIKTIASLSFGKFVPAITCLHEQEGVRKIEVDVQGTKYSAKLRGGADYIDLALIDFVNECLLGSGLRRKKFVAFRDVGFGQEIAVALVGKFGLEALKRLDRVEIVKE